MDWYFTSVFFVLMVSQKLSQEMESRSILRCTSASFLAFSAQSSANRNSKSVNVNLGLGLEASQIEKLSIPDVYAWVTVMEGIGKHC